MSALAAVGTHPAGLGPEEALSSLGTRVTSLLPVLASLGMRLISSAAAFGGIAPSTNERSRILLPHLHHIWFTQRIVIWYNIFVPLDSNRPTVLFIPSF